MKTRDMKVVTLNGAPRDRGRRLGETLREDIRIVLEKRDAMIAEHGYRPEDYWAALDKHCDFGPAIQRWTPDLAAEVEGLAEGAAIDPDTAFRLQLLDEDWFFDAFHYSAFPKPSHKCTTFAIGTAEDGQTYAGQNMDIHHSADGHQVLLRIEDERNGLESLVFTYAGLIGLMGMNSAPLGINCNTLMQLGFCPTRLPVAFVVRHLLSLKTMDNAIRFLRHIQHASGQTYTLSTRGSVACFECGPGGIAEYKPLRDARLCHTNHPLTNVNTDQFDELASRPGSGIERITPNSQVRLNSIGSRVLNVKKPPNLAELKSALRARDDPENPVCKEAGVSMGNIGFTAGSVIYEMSDPPIFHCASGPPRLTDYHRFFFK
ncbi:MAG: C45 family peptidase [Hyphomicrobiales bacterium]|nr:C45 family peptidase [Hyphomicrobiales bacterium]